MEKDKKPCLIHACLPSNCGCPDEVSQLDYRQTSEVVSFTEKDLSRLIFSSVPAPGRYLQKETIVRKPDRISSDIEFEPLA
jgi:hypothetical protein